MAIIKIRNAAIDLDAAEIPNLPASKITSGTFANNKLTGSGAITINGSSVALGASTTIATGLSWQSTIVTASTLTAVSGNGYWINTTSNACTITLPANPSLGDEIVFVDYARNWGTNSITINTNSKKFQGNTSPNPVYNTSGQSVSIVYSDTTQGWIPTVDDDVSLETPQTFSLEMLVIAGGAGGGGNYYGAGGGAGGYRTSTQTVSPNGTTFTITVGDGGVVGTSSTKGGNGSNSSISGTGLTTITSTGGGGGGTDHGNKDGVNGGSGGGGSGYATSAASRGLGNTPSTSPSQGNDGGSSTASGQYGSGGGGGAGAVGGSTSNSNGGAGGAGTASSITGSSVTRAGGGGGCGSNDGGNGGTSGAGGSGGGGAGARQSPAVAGVAGTINTGGGGGAGADPSAMGGAGGKGVVILSMPDSSYSGTTTGSPTVATGVSGKTVLTFNGSGSYTT